MNSNIDNDIINIKIPTLQCRELTIESRRIKAILNTRANE